jgi:hypothetical protein
VEGLSPRVPENDPESGDLSAYIDPERQRNGSWKAMIHWPSDRLDSEEKGFDMKSGSAEFVLSNSTSALVATLLHRVHPIP